MWLVRLYYHLTFKKPSQKLGWSLEDFKIAKHYCLSKRHPNLKNHSFWDFIKNRDSVEILHFVNQEIFPNE